MNKLFFRGSGINLHDSELKDALIMPKWEIKRKTKVLGRLVVDWCIAWCKDFLTGTQPSTTDVTDRHD